jgi:microcystin-dependent protein
MCYNYDSKIRGGIFMADNYTDTTDTNFKGANYNIDTGKPLSAEGMRNALHTKENVVNKIESGNSLSASSTDNQYPSAKLMYKELQAVKNSLNSLEILPKGTILAMSTNSWANAGTEFQSKWRVCDGTGGAPDLRGRFLRGGTSSDAATGGANSQSITLSISNMPSHNHGIPSHNSGPGGDVYLLNNYNASSPVELDQIHHYTKNTGGNQPFTVNTLPAYYTVIYIMKVA